MLTRRDLIIKWSAYALAALALSFLYALLLRDAQPLRTPAGLRSQADPAHLLLDVLWVLGQLDRAPGRRHRGA